MDYWSALEMLGLEASEDLTRDRLRRSYLRRLRNYPPERDPAGFRRLREALELLEPLVALEAPPPSAPGRSTFGEPASASPVAFPVVVLAGASVAAPSTTPSSAADPVTSSPVAAATTTSAPTTTDPLTSSSAAAASTSAPCTADPLTGSPVAAAARTSAPTSTDPLTGSPVAAAASTSAPSTAPASTADPVTSSPVAAAASTSAPSSIADPVTSSPAAAAASIAAPSAAPEIAAAASERLAGAGEAAQDLTLDALIDQLLAMLERAGADPALELAQRWRERVIDDHRMTSAGTAQRWALTRDLLAVAVALPSPILRALARAIAANDVAAARPALEVYRTRNPDQARDLERHLRKRAPTVHQFVAGALDDPWALAEPRQPPRPERWGRAPWMAVIAVVLFAGRLAATCGPPTPAIHSQDIMLSPTAVERLRGLGTTPIIRLAQALERDPHASSAQIAAAVSISLAARRASCPALEAGLAQLWSAAGSAPPGQTATVDDLMLQISHQVTAQCGDGSAR
jgi:hypothetical protein